MSNKSAVAVAEKQEFVGNGHVVRINKPSESDFDRVVNKEMTPEQWKQNAKLLDCSIADLKEKYLPGVKLTLNKKFQNEKKIQTELRAAAFVSLVEELVVNDVDAKTIMNKVRRKYPDLYLDD